MISSTTNGIERLKISENATNGTDTVDKSTVSNGNCSNRDGNYYIQQLTNTRERLVRTADVLDKELETLLAQSDTPEDVIGHLRSASGKARLLASQKIKQFEDLCHKNLNPPPDDAFPTKLEDLEGFWDMVMLQVDDCDATFARIETYRKNGWRVPEEESHVDSSPARPAVRATPSNKRPSVPRIAAKDVERTPTSILAAKKREEQRQKMAEMKRQYKLQQEQLKNKAAENGTNNESSENLIINH
ncbi:disks large-associated protein 4 [Culicoides brevitarsis]|uniref:disks large-associated protein 4 n=1 Tax=Culicoides brevitarsis TaxID=469753 RepID=UPI00307BAD3B